MPYSNCYEDAARADAYARLEFHATYYLAYRDLPQIFRKHVRGIKALDFGCGAGRSTRFLKQHGFTVTGIDISPDMLERARVIDPEGDYRLIRDGDFSAFEENTFDLILCAFTFDNIPTMERKVSLFTGLGKLLNSEGKMVIVVSAPEIYLHEWASFSTKDFPENRYAKNGEIVRVIVTDMDDKRPVEDIIWFDDAYESVFKQAQLEIVESLRPLGKPEEPYPWINETRIAPWVIYVLQRSHPKGKATSS